MTIPKILLIGLLFSIVLFFLIRRLTKGYKPSAKVITYCYTQDGMQFQKVIGVIGNQLLDVLNARNEIMDFYKREGAELTKEEFDEDTHNFYLKYNDKYQSRFYSGDFPLGEIKL